MDQEIPKLGLFRTYVLPSLVLFVVPAFSWWFFSHAQARFDRQILTSIEQDIRRDPRVPAEQREQMLEFFRAVPMSRVLASSAPELQGLRDQLADETKWYYATFRWMIRLAVFCIAAGVAVFAVTGVSVLLSLRSPRTQYLSLAAGWHVLRIFSTLQVLAQAALLVALSFWITALWFNFYSVRLIAIIGILAIASTLPVLAAIFKRVESRFEVQGELLERERSPRLWDDLAAISGGVGVDVPDQVIAGIDVNFFVTETPVAVGDTTCTGRTLFVSLSLLKTLREAEADAVLAHELAHFSGHDTVFSRKISPLLIRYQHHLEALHAGVLSRPVFYCAVLFRALFELSLGALSRQREFRADRIAAEQTSRDDVAHALLRITAYAEYRQQVESELFESQTAHDRANISQRIEAGYHQFAATFAEQQDVAKLTTAHPFDSHPPLGARLESLGYRADKETINRVLSESSGGAWFDKIPAAAELEQAQWSAYEEEFRKFHENVLAFRYLPSTDEERALVEKYFPTRTVASVKGKSATFDAEKIIFEDWDAPVYYHEIKSVSSETDWGRPRLNLIVERGKRMTIQLPLSKLQSAQQEMAEVLQNYGNRYAAAAAYQESLQEQQGGAGHSTNDDAAAPPLETRRGHEEQGFTSRGS